MRIVASKALFIAPGHSPHRRGGRSLRSTHPVGAMTNPSAMTRGLRLLRTAVERERSARPGFNASRLAEVTGIERSHASRLTQELRNLNYLERAEGHAFRAGPEFFAVAAALNLPWVRGARVELRSLASRFRLSARLTTRDGARAVLIRYETGVGAAGTSVRPGMVTPTWCTGAGRALLWDHAREELDALLRDVQFVGVGGPGAARTVAEVDALMERDRSRGIVHAIEEFEEGLTEFAIPLRSPNGEIAAAISASTAELDAHRTTELCSALIEASDRLSAMMMHASDRS